MITKELALFTYGSLFDGMVHHNKISPYIVAKEDAFITGSIYRLPSGFPAFVQCTNDCGVEHVKIYGQRVVLQAPDVLHHMLDEFHGVSHLVPEKSLYFKLSVQCETSSGENKESFTYVMNKAKLPKSACLISDGDWLTDIKNNPVFSSNLTEKQATYIKKLSQSSGRDIVPIDIALYRELMKLDLIVDKGRRLALSKLGAEVARYLPD